MFIHWLAPLGITPEQLGIAAGLIFAISVVPYIIDIFRGNTKPSRTAYMIWAVIQMITLTSYLASGASTTAFFSCLYYTLELDYLRLVN